MNIKKTLDYIKKYPKDYALCHTFLSNHEMTKMLEILKSILKMETPLNKITENEFWNIQELVWYIEDLIRDQDWYDSFTVDEDVPDDLFLNEDDNEKF